MCKESSTSERKKPGRPAGSPNRQYDIVDVEMVPLSKCRCGSTDRSAYSQNPEKHTQKFSDGMIVTTWQKTQCLRCGQWRKDRTQQIVRS